MYRLLRNASRWRAALNRLQDLHEKLCTDHPIYSADPDRRDEDFDFLKENTFRLLEALDAPKELYGKVRYAGKPNSTFAEILTWMSTEIENKRVEEKRTVEGDQQGNNQVEEGAAETTPDPPRSTGWERGRIGGREKVLKVHPKLWSNWGEPTLFLDLLFKAGKVGLSNLDIRPHRLSRAPSVYVRDLRKKKSAPARQFIGKRIADLRKKYKDKRYRLF